MPRDPRVDAYIAQAQPFARPLLERLRALVHAACPEVEETIKWGMPAFYHHGPMCGMAAFRAHCTFSFWKASLIPGLRTGPGRGAMGHFGRLTGLADLPSQRALAGYLRAAVRLNEAGTKVARPKPAKKPAVRTPPDLAAALAKRPGAQAAWRAFAPSHRREYVAWLAEARRPETRRARLVHSVAWIAAGKPRNWKYVKRS